MEAWNPLGPAAVDDLLRPVPLGPASRILDVGCGPAASLVRSAARTGGAAVGVDRHPHAARPPRAAATRAGVGDLVAIKEENFDASVFSTSSFDLILCNGASQAVGTPREAVAALAPLLRTGGHLLLGEGFWERAPDPGYLAFLGAAREDYADFEGTRALAAAGGLLPAADRACTRAEWDAYEDGYAANVERWAAAHPDDPAAPAFLDRIRAWRAAYLKWGRGTLGFGLYLFRRPA